MTALKSPAPFRWSARLPVAVGLFVVAALLAARRAGATTEAPVRLDVQDAGALPFSPGQLQAAVEARLPVAHGGDPDATPVHIAPADGGNRVLVVGTQARLEVLVAGKSPAEAARLVALAVVDVARPVTFETPAAVAAVATPTTDATTATTAISTTVAAPTPGLAGGWARLSVGVAPGISVGLGASAVAFEPTVALAARVGRAALAPLAVTLTAGVARPSADWRDQALTVTTVPVRLGARWRWRYLEVGAGGAARLFTTSGLDGRSGTMWGGFASAGTWGALGRGVQWTATAACDAYRDKVLFRAAGEPVLTLGPVVLWLGVGARFGGGA